MSRAPPSLETSSYASPPITIILTVVLLVFFFVGFFSIFFCRCFFENLFSPWNLRQSPSSANQMGPAPPSDGLDPSLLQAFPTFVYSSIKDFREENYGLECAICLAEFEDDSVLRLLTVCYHVFHEECIDLWLTSHKTCPVCRGNLDLPLGKLLEMGPQVTTAPAEITKGRIRENEKAPPAQGAVRINIKEGEEDEEYRGGGGGGGGDPAAAITVRENCKMDKYPRSHSTGHSLARNKADEEKYMFKLQDHVKIQISRGHTGSCITFGEFSDHEDMTSNGGFDRVLGHSMH